MAIFWGMTQVCSMNIKAVAAFFVAYVEWQWIDSYVILTTSKPNIVIVVYQNKSAVIDSSLSCLSIIYNLY